MPVIDSRPAVPQCDAPSPTDGRTLVPHCSTAASVERAPAFRFPWSGGPRPFTVTLKFTWPRDVGIGSVRCTVGCVRGRVRSTYRDASGPRSGFGLWDMGGWATRNSPPRGPSLGSASRGPKRPRARCKDLNCLRNERRHSLPPSLVPPLSRKTSPCLLTATGAIACLLCA